MPLLREKSPTTEGLPLPATSLLSFPGPRPDPPPTLKFQRPASCVARGATFGPDPLFLFLPLPANSPFTLPGTMVVSGVIRLPIVPQGGLSTGGPVFLTAVAKCFLLLFLMDWLFWKS
jgi:hypothetical protein